MIKLIKFLKPYIWLILALIVVTYFQVTANLKLPEYMAKIVNEGILLKNVDIIYTKEKETADQYIEKTAKAIGKKYIVRVATSDVVEQVIILSSGATRVSCDKMFEEIKSMGKNFDKYKTTSKHIKSNPLENWMSSEMIETMEKLRRGIVD